MMDCVWNTYRRKYRCVNCGCIRRLPVRRRCDAKCALLGPEIEYRDGITLMVKCNCKGDREREVFHAAHQCDHPENKHGHCLPTLQLRTDEDRQAWAERKPESELYRVCQQCQDRTLPPDRSPVAHSAVPA